MNEIPNDTQITSIVLTNVGQGLLGGTLGGPKRKPFGVNNITSSPFGGMGSS